MEQSPSEVELNSAAQQIHLLSWNSKVFTRVRRWASWIQFKNLIPIYLRTIILYPFFYASVPLQVFPTNIFVF
jgi:hypothetical protein